jgi:hypothetical protein
MDHLTDKYYDKCKAIVNRTITVINTMSRLNSDTVKNTYCKSNES